MQVMDVAFVPVETLPPILLVTLPCTVSSFVFFGADALPEITGFFLGVDFVADFVVALGVGFLAASGIGFTIKVAFLDIAGLQLAFPSCEIVSAQIPSL